MDTRGQETRITIRIPAQSAEMLRTLAKQQQNQTGYGVLRTDIPR